jgi:hypothetical protein
LIPAQQNHSASLLIGLCAISSSAGLRHKNIQPLSLHFRRRSWFGSLKNKKWDKLEKKSCRDWERDKEI